MCDEAWKIIIEIISEREAQIKFNINQVRNIRQIKGNMGRILYIAHGNINKNRTTIFRANGSCDECEMKAKEEEKRAGFRVSENLLAAILAGAKPGCVSERDGASRSERERTLPVRGKWVRILSAKRADDWGRSSAKMTAECWKLELRRTHSRGSERERAVDAQDRERERERARLMGGKGEGGKTRW